MAKTLASRISDGMKSGNERIPAQAHAALSAGNVVQIDPATGLTSAPADNDRLGLFGVAENDVASGAEGSFKIRGHVLAMTGDASAVGTLMNPMSDLKIDAMGTQTDGNGFCKLLETGVDGELKMVLIYGQ